jgi:hypothetical protein
MPLSKDPKGGGTEASGTISTEFCSHCYADGKFNAPDMTAEQMVQLVEGKLKEMHIPGFLARRMAKDIPTLKRWASQLRPSLRTVAAFRP